MAQTGSAPGAPGGGTAVVEGKDAQGTATTAKPVLVGMAGSASTFELQTALALGDADNGNHVLAVAIYAFNASTMDRVQSMSGVGDGLGVILASQPSSTYGTATATGATATVTFAAVAGQKHRLTSATTSYTGALTAAANASITDAAATIFLWLGAVVPYGPPMPSGGIKQAAVNTAMTVSILSGGVGAVGNVLASKITA